MERSSIDAARIGGDPIHAGKRRAQLQRKGIAVAARRIRAGRQHILKVVGLQHFLVSAVAAAGQNHGRRIIGPLAERIGRRYAGHLFAVVIDASHLRIQHQADVTVCNALIDLCTECLHIAGAALAAGFADVAIRRNRIMHARHIQRHIAAIRRHALAEIHADDRIQPIHRATAVLGKSLRQRRVIHALSA